MSSFRPLRPSYDAVIVGARAAGAATALLLARHGLSVLAIDKGRYGSDALSTHALLRVGVAQLERWGVLAALRAAGTPTVRQTTFHYGANAVTVPIKVKDGIDGLYAPRRTVLDAALVDAAQAAGADVRHETRLVELWRAESGRVTGVVLADRHGALHRVRAGIVVGADGVRSAVAEGVGAEAYRHGEHATRDPSGGHPEQLSDEAAPRRHAKGRRKSPGRPPVEAPRHAASAFEPGAETPHRLGEIVRLAGKADAQEHLAAGTEGSAGRNAEPRLVHQRQRQPAHVRHAVDRKEQIEGAVRAGKADAI